MADYAALAKQFGGVEETPASQPVDYSALAAQYGGQVQPPTTTTFETKGVPVQVSPAPITPVQRPRTTVFEEVTGAITEPIMKMGSSMIAKPVSDIGGIAAMFADYLGVAPNNPVETKRKIEEAMTYQPRTAAGASSLNPLNFIPDAIGGAITKGANVISEPIRGDAGADTARGMTANAINEAVPQALGLIGVKKAPTALKPLSPESFAQRAATKAVQASEADWARTGVIESGKIAKKYGWVTNPAVVNPSLRSTVDNAIVNSDYFNAAASIRNAKKFNDLAREAAGIEKNKPLTAEAYSEAKAKNGAPYREAAKLGKIKPDPDLLDKVQKIEVPTLMGTNEVDIGRVSRLKDNIVNSLNEGTDAAELIKTTTTLRKDAKATIDLSRKQQIDPTDRAVAEAKLEIADILDQHLERNASGDLAKRLKDSRVKFAQIYQLERATNLATHQIDPNIFASEMSGKHNFTGALYDMGYFAANHPEVSNVGAKQVGTKIQVPVRSGPAGTLGFAAGSLIGAPVATSAVSAGLASVGGKLRLHKMLSDEYQAARTVPLDRRISPAPPLNPAETPYKPAAGSNQVAPYDYSQQTYPSGYTPNFAAPRPAPAEMKGLTFDARTGKVVPEDVSNTVRVPNDKALAEYLRAQEASRIADAKEAALAKLSDRNAKAAAAREAAIAREKLMDAVEQLQEKLGNPRPTNLGGQGPKTRAFKRGLLTGENQ